RRAVLGGHESQPTSRQGASGVRCGPGPNRTSADRGVPHGQMDPAEVIAIEIKQYVGQGLTALVPKLIGQTAEAETKEPLRNLHRRTWNENSFISAPEASRGAAATEAAQGLLAWAKDEACDSGGAMVPSRARSSHC